MPKSDAEKFAAELEKCKTYIETVVKPALKAIGAAMKLAGKEANEAINALVVGAFKGEAGKAEALAGCSGPAWPERTAFEMGVMGGPVLRAWLLTQLTEQVLPLAKDFLKGILTGGK